MKKLKYMALAVLILMLPLYACESSNVTSPDISKTEMLSTAQQSIFVKRSLDKNAEKVPAVTEPILTMAKFVNTWTMQFAFEEFEGSETSAIDPSTVEASDIVLTDPNGNIVQLGSINFHWGWYFSTSVTRADGVWEFTVLANSVADTNGVTNSSDMTLKWNQQGDIATPIDPDPESDALWRIRWGYNNDPTTWTNLDYIEADANGDPILSIDANPPGEFVFFQIQFRRSPIDVWGADFPGQWSEIVTLYVTVCQGYTWPPPDNGLDPYAADNFPLNSQYRVYCERAGNDYKDNAWIWNWFGWGSAQIDIGGITTIGASFKQSCDDPWRACGGGRYLYYFGYREPSAYPNFYVDETLVSLPVEVLLSECDRPSGGGKDPKPTIP